MADSSNVNNQLSTLNIFEATVRAVDPVTGEIYISDSISGSSTEKIPPVYYGGVADSGVFQHPEEGDSIICTRVHPGAQGITQAIRVIPKNDAHIASESNVPEGSPPGRSNYPTRGLSPGDVRICGSAGGEIFLSGSTQGPLSNTSNKGVFVGTQLKSGLYVYNEKAHRSSLTIISNSTQSVSSGHRSLSGDVFRTPAGEISSSTPSSGHILLAYTTNLGLPRGLSPGTTASVAHMLGAPRNPAISEHRTVINEFSEDSFFNGWDKEASYANDAGIPSYLRGKISTSLMPGNILNLAPHQLIESIGGNVVNKRGESLDLNYGVVRVGNSFGRIAGGNLSEEYERARATSRRGIGYHFQLSTNSKSTETSNDYENFVCAIDKEGILKLNVPKASNSGNVLYPTRASFYASDGSIRTAPDTFRATEKVPITLRNKDNDVILPSETAADAMSSTEDGIKRGVGVRFTNEDDYFQGSGHIMEGEDIRINPTKHHNMYAAAEMLIANTIRDVLIPFQNAKCTGYIPGNSIGKSFERKIRDVEADGSDGTEVNYMSAVGVSPAPPAMDTGGGVFVAGQDFTLDTEENGSRVNFQYTNSFSPTAPAIPADGSGEARLDPGGKSANLNFEGSIEASVGKDNHDEKSIVLDTAGSLVAWFGRDRRGRSMVVQTDGEVLLNVGGTNGDTFNAGRFDLRVNVTHKGFLGEDDVNVTNASDYIISISEAGLVIAGMKPGAPMVIRNAGEICMESTAKLILAGQTVEIREGNRPPRKTYKDPVSTDTPDATIEGVQEQITCILDAIDELQGET